MNWSFRIARIAGIDLNIHITMLLMLPLGALLWGGPNPSLNGALFGMLMVVLLFGSVLLHELGHALTARALDIPVREIQLLPLGGVAILGRPVLNPGQELLITMMGPIVNVLIIIGLAIVAVVTGVFTRLTPDTVTSMFSAISFDGAVLWLIQANLLLVLFNMIPAFPLDGGRMMRAMLAFVTNYRRATLVAATIGQGCAILLGLWGLSNMNFLLLATALFIFLAARQEVAVTEAVTVLHDLKVADLLREQPPALQVGQRVREAAELLRAEGLFAVAVLQGERPLGIVTRPEIEALMHAGRGEVWITLAMRRELPSVAADAPLEAARLTMAEHDSPVVMALEGTNFRGLITLEDIAAAYARHDGKPPQAPASPSTSPSA
ncbi:MAG: site-2 protease family protein [Oscillochloridaceae bacterium umkhey_bin13]